ncbi:MAG: helix-turn-helix transcriptional regulator [Alteraurantiacibacter sp.]
MIDLARTPKQIGSAVRRARRTQMLSQTQLAERAGLRQELISKIERGSSGTRIEAICSLLAALDLEFTIQSRTRVSDTRIEDIF